MKIGCCANLQADPDGPGMAAIEIIAEAGFDYIELPLAKLMTFAEAEFHQLQERIRAAGIRCEACCNFFPPDLKLTGDGVQADRIVAYYEAALERVHQLGAEIVVFGSAGARNVPEGFGKERAWNQLVELLRDMDPVARQYGITIVIEPLNRKESNIVNSVAEGLQLANAVQRDNIQLLVDYYHLSLENEDPADIVTAGAAIRHAHLAEPEGRAFPKAQSRAAYAAFIEALRQIRYSGRLSIEASTDDLRRDAKAGLAFLKELTLPLTEH
ncbi:sugar phosphate isomerase/epimerase [Hydrogenispora ethanolica]|uniref:Sugar phosphate isomerase/epimerase n=1 Tax=Hydrogenispora ethanolica TaxID=1082276 RepID=A0A4V2QC41_HYDET|nr:sugar phosphate isomerase/epimerase family protein [Hydrogenispora ethanolica]TCL58817.1 sugar phosphate isomerase/epimerase [Hydrogenispora ethanolica]